MNDNIRKIKIGKIIANQNDPKDTQKHDEKTFQNLSANIYSWLAGSTPIQNWSKVFVALTMNMAVKYRALDLRAMQIQLLDELIDSAEEAKSKLIK